MIYTRQKQPSKYKWDDTIEIVPRFDYMKQRFVDDDIDGALIIDLLLQATRCTSLNGFPTLL